ncbi:MAG TPA: alcohol dehydrogenase catalytic domain-containing protein [Candidatus Limnocylindria bacterium]
MKAALLVAPGELLVEKIPDPQAGPGEVRIAVGGVGLCGSDLSVFSGRWQVPRYPWVMGHEAFGVIESVGEGVPPGRVGETVVIEPNAVCFACDQCLRGRTSACTRRQSVGMNRAGALAELLVVPSRFAWSVGEMDPRDMVCVEPMTVVQAALRRNPEALPRSALVVGVGPQGLLMSLALLERGIEVQAHDVNPDRVAFAAGFGARPASAEPSERFALIVDTVGSPTSMETALERLEVGGTLILLGLDSRPFDLTAQRIVRGQMVLRGSLTYDHPTDFEHTIAAIAAGRLGPGRIITDEYPMDDAQFAFDRNPRARGKTWIRVGTHPPRLLTRPVS